jgi:smad nuclear-interacting protein 1
MQAGASSAPPPPGTGSGAPVERASFALSGALSRDAVTGNSRNGVVLKFASPPDEVVADKKWRFFVYRDGAHDAVDMLFLHRRGSYLLGRDERVCDICVGHPSVSSQHAALCFRSVPLPREPGDERPPAHEVRPYAIDLESTHGTRLNGARVPPARFVQLKSGDVLRFAHSTKEYVLMEDSSLQPELRGVTAAAE